MKGVTLPNPAGFVALVEARRNRSCAHPVGVVRRLLRWIDAALWDTHRREAEREIARVIGGSVDHLSDDLERRIQQHFIRNGNFRV